MIINPHFRSGSVTALAKLRERWVGCDRYLLMDADVLYPPYFLSLLCSAGVSADVCLLSDFASACDAEAVKVVESSNYGIVDFGKVVTAKGTRVGESVGFFSLSARAAEFFLSRAQWYIDRGATNLPYENVVRDALRSGLFAFDLVDVSGAPWAELDSPSDIEFAEAEIMPRLRSILRDGSMLEAASE